MRQVPDHDQLERSRGRRCRKIGLERGRGGLEGGLKHTFAGGLGVFRGVLGAQKASRDPKRACGGLQKLLLGAQGTVTAL